MFVVQIEKPENQKLDRWFAEVRNWLDLHRCEPAAFVRAGRRLDRLIYRISFNEPATARAFAEEFARYAPVMRRATLSERAELSPVSAGLGDTAAAREPVAG